MNVITFRPINPLELSSSQETNQTKPEDNENILNASEVIYDREKENEGRKEEEEDEIVSMVEVLAEQEALEESADAVLGGSDERNCTYLQV